MPCRPYLASESPGLYVISTGLSRTFADDREPLRYGMLLYDALHAWCKDNAHTRTQG
ncbi:chromate resistance protein [Paraburkholderia sp. LEh10]|uniref:chromate resistance protein ChrB domain-containing protein n=1 Tax=Paraburkholderia sp. LEh10 TaxID=2821353 RepID=UPI001AE4DAD7|nr:chromate resistance protein [Paraburkholderia sp. LEh10]